MTLHLTRVDGGQQIDFEPRSLVVAGFTGRNREAVAAHIEELARLGVPEPAGVPAFYPLSAELLTTAPEILVESPATSGEVEPVLFCVNGSRFVGVGSDHTARDLERVDIALAKAACPKVVGTRVIAYRDAVDQWNRLEMCTRTGREGDLYQEGRAEELLPIPELLALMTADGHELSDGTAVFLGTLGLKAADFVYSDRWALEMSLPGGPSLTCSYGVAVTSQTSEVMT